MWRCVHPNKSPKLADLWNCFYLGNATLNIDEAHELRSQHKILSHTLVYSWFWAPNRFKNKWSSDVEIQIPKNSFNRDMRTPKELQQQQQKTNNVWLIHTHTFLMNCVLQRPPFLWNNIFTPVNTQLSDNSFDSVFNFRHRHQRWCAARTRTVDTPSERLFVIFSLFIGCWHLQFGRLLLRLFRASDCAFDLVRFDRVYEWFCRKS